ncbi:hypothetical protein EK21DRAFT_95455 [Setomelanomma holmii]|uniref:Uncharacterized protein n=1 Tax=Setomelanomma holmii TaxID=210430 RepID=A0A9P4GTQ6_9PLEO|nr:hypothetical protein EK21DRAFT_95455 [Setomelanomma holmii]
MCSLARLFNLTPVQDSIVEWLLPFDIARLIAATGCHFATCQREKYMNPVRDVFTKPEEIELLTDAGVNIILLGCKAHLLHERLNNTERFIENYGNDFVIDLIAIAYCPPEPSTNALTPSARFTVTDQVLEKLGSRTDIAYSWLEHSISTLPCTNTSLTPATTPAASNVRLQIFRLNLRCCWFNTIDFVYPEEALGIFDWSYDDGDDIETSAVIISHDSKKYSFLTRRYLGNWLSPVTSPLAVFERGTPALTHHRPNVNMDEVLVRLEIPSENKVGIVRMRITH